MPYIPALVMMLMLLFLANQVKGTPEQTYRQKNKNTHIQKGNHLKSKQKPYQHRSNEEAKFKDPAIW